MCKAHPTIEVLGHLSYVVLTIEVLGHLSYVVLITGLTVEGYIWPQLAAVLLAAFVLFRALFRVFGGARGWLDSWAFKTICYFVPVVIVLLKGGLSQAVFIIVEALYGGIEQITVGILDLAAQGHISVLFAILAIFILVVLRKLGSGHRLSYYIIFKVLAPLFALIVLASKWGGEWSQTVLTFGSVLALLLMVEGIYLISGGFFTLTRK